MEQGAHLRRQIGNSGLQSVLAQRGALARLRERSPQRRHLAAEATLLRGGVRCCVRIVLRVRCRQRRLRVGLPSLRVCNLQAKAVCAARTRARPLRGTTRATATQHTLVHMAAKGATLALAGPFAAAPTAARERHARKMPPRCRHAQLQRGAGHTAHLLRRVAAHRRLVALCARKSLLQRSNARLERRRRVLALAHAAPQAFGLLLQLPLAPLELLHARPELLALALQLLDARVALRELACVRRARRLCAPQLLSQPISIILRAARLLRRLHQAASQHNTRRGARSAMLPWQHQGGSGLWRKARGPYAQLCELLVSLADARREFRLQVGELLVFLAPAIVRLGQPLPQVGVLGAQHAVERRERGHLALDGVHGAAACARAATCETAQGLEIAQNCRGRITRAQDVEQDLV